MRNALAPDRSYYVTSPDAEKRADDQSDAVAFVWSYAHPNGMRWRAAIFVGKQNKPVSNYYFRTEAARDAEIASQFEARRAALANKKHVRDERNATGNPFKAGDILYSSWGATMWFTDFFSVIESKGKTLVIRPIRGKKIATHHDGGITTPMPGDYIGEERKVRVVGGRAKVSDHHYAQLATFKEVGGIKVYDSHGYTDVD